MILIKEHRRPYKSTWPGHQVATAYEIGWSNMSNGEVLDAAENQFDLLITTDQNLRYQRLFHTDAWL